MDDIFDAVYGEEGLEASVDLEAQTLILHTEDGDKTYSFDYDDSVKNKLLNGLDDIEESLQYLDDIKEFESSHKTWIHPQSA